MQLETYTIEESTIQKQSMRELIFAEGRSDKSSYTSYLYSEGYVEAVNNTVFCFRNSFDAYKRKNIYNSSLVGKNSFSLEGAIYAIIKKFYSDSSRIEKYDDRLVHKRYAIVKPERITLIMGYVCEECIEDIYDMYADSDYFGVFLSIDINRNLFLDDKWKNEMRNIVINSKTYGDNGVYKSILLKDIFRTGSNLDFKVELEEQ